MPRKKTTPDVPAPVSKSVPQKFDSSIRYDPEPKQRFGLYPIDQAPVKTEPTFDDLMDAYRKGELKDVQLADLQMRMKKRAEDESTGASTMRPKRYNVFNGQMFPDPEGAFTLNEALQVRALDAMQNPAQGQAEGGEKVSDILSAVHPYIAQPVMEGGGPSLQDALLAGVINNIPSSQDQLNTSLQISQMIESAKTPPVPPAPPVDTNALLLGAIQTFAQLKEIFAPPPAPSPASSAGLISIGGEAVPIETMEKYFGLQMRVEDFNEKKRLMGTLRESIPQALKTIGEMATSIQNKDQPVQQPIQQPQREGTRTKAQEIVAANWERVTCDIPECGMEFLVPPGHGESVFCPKCSKSYIDQINEQVQKAVSDHEKQSMNGDNGHQENRG